jgi:adenylosuccinate synthase
MNRQQPFIAGSGSSGPPAAARRAILLVDLAFGDAGKGTMIDYLVRRYSADLVVRFNGGPQAGHNVVLPDGRHHMFSQFGSGAFVPGVRTLLSRYMLVEPYALLNESDHLATLGITDALQRTAIDDRCLLIAPPQQVLNQLRERARGASAHGTCGRGVGECVADDLEHPELSLHAGDLRDRGQLRRKLQALLEHKRAQADVFREFASAEQSRILDDAGWIEPAVEIGAAVAAQAEILSPDASRALLRSAACSIFEAAQGVLLDERFGFHPHTTWSKTTFTNADALLDEAEADAVRQRLGVMRTYMTRHGPGPFPTEDPDLHLPEPHNADDGWQGRFRRGLLDLVMLRYALDACGGVDGLAVTHLDRLPMLPRSVCQRYQIGDSVFGTLPAPPGHPDIIRLIAQARATRSPWRTDSEDAYLAMIQVALGVPVLHRSHGPTWREKN